MQRVKNGKTVDCRAPNAQEIRDFLFNCWKKIMSKTALPTAAKPASVDKPPTGDKPIPFGFYPEFSLDNTNVHICAYNPPKGQVWAQKPPGATFGSVQPPAYSPDLHKVIEHVHAVLCTAFMKQIEQTNGPSRGADIKTYFKQLEQLFYQLITPESIQKDAKSLRKTIEEVKRLEGGWPAAKFR
jgi:hypothetical protein